MIQHPAHAVYRALLNTRDPQQQLLRVQELLQDPNFDPNARSSDELTPMIAAILLGATSEVLDALCEAGAQITNELRERMKQRLSANPALADFLGTLESRTEARKAIP